ncbi:MAG: DinB family protein [Acidimicrobiia bacterium]
MCPECGFEYRPDEAGAAGAAIIAGAAEIAVLISAGDVRTRRAPQTWSALEYACHVRDVLLVQRERVLQARREDCPTPAPMGRDERVEHDGHAGQDPAAVARQLSDAARMFANVLDRLSDDAWDRTMIYNYPVPTERSLHWVAVHTQHEVVHHVRDTRAQLT